mgnify:CR=1 FL=1
MSQQKKTGFGFYTWPSFNDMMAETQKQLITPWAAAASTTLKHTNELHTALLSKCQEAFQETYSHAATGFEKAINMTDKSYTFVQDQLKKLQ